MKADNSRVREREIRTYLAKFVSEFGGIDELRDPVAITRLQRKFLQRNAV